MARVYLPLGYPAVSGVEGELIIYQGTVVRMYEIPKDPRTNEQLYQRRFLADLVKMRSTLGLWGRGACRAALGSKWSTVVFQFAKLNYNSWWSDAWDTWEEFTEAQMEDWRLAAPAQATFNDPGRVFYTLSLFLHNLIDEKTSHPWESLYWGANQSDEALAWWSLGISGVFTKSKVDDRSTYLNYVGTWAQEGAAFSYLTTLSGAARSPINYLHFYCKARFLTFYFAKGAGYGNLSVFCDGVSLGSISQLYNGGGELWQQEQTVDMLYNGLHHVKVYGTSGFAVNIDAVKVA